MNERGQASGSSRRAWWISALWSSRDYVKRVWDNSAEDNVLFLAGGISFNILLAALPFVLLLLTGLTYLLPAISGVSSTTAINSFIDSLLPTHSETSGST